MTDWVEVPFEVQKPQDGWRVDAYLAQRLKRYSRSAVQKLIGDGQVSVAGRLVKPAARVSAGQTVVVRYPKADEPPPKTDRLDVLYEDDWLLAVDKPAGVLSHPTDKIVANSVTSILKKQAGAALHLGHRLDRETSGVLLLCKDPSTAGLLTHSFVARAVRKTYCALAAGRISWERKTVDAPLDNEGGEIRVKQAVGRGLPAVTEFERLDACDAFSVVAARPKTGRLHQIRAHLAFAGHPVLGDKLYTGDGAAYLKAVDKTLTEDDLTALGAPRQMLHAWRLELKHPVTDAPLDIRAPLPADFLEALAAAGLEAPRG